MEVALLDASTLTPLVGTTTGLTQTDSLLNLQHNGQAYFSPKVTLAGAKSSGGTISLDSARTVKIDISQIAPGTLATLSFDLLGFGARDSSVVIDNVTLLNDGITAPTAVDDTAMTEQGKSVIINVLANDSDADGTLDPTSIQIGSAPTHGSVTVKADGTLAYTPAGQFFGTDTFGYTVSDSDRALSNEAQSLRASD